MNKQAIETGFSSLSFDELLKKKKKITTHCVNLECKKEQLLILIEKLIKISGERADFLSFKQEKNIVSKCLNGVGSYVFFIKEQLNQAQKNRKKIEQEILQTKEQIKLLNCVLTKKQV